MIWRETTIYTVTATVLFTLSVVVLILLVTPFEILLFRRWPPRGHLLRSGLFIRTFWAKHLLKALNVKVVVEGPGAQGAPGGCVLVGNHQSLLDIPILAAAYLKPFAFFSKKELLRIPLFGWAAWLSGVVFVDREKGVRDGNALHTIREVLKRGAAVVIFPEGTRSPDGVLKNFKRGAFVIAIDTEAPVLPFVIQGSGRLLPKGKLCVKGGTVRVWLGEPIPTKGHTSDDRFALSERVRELVSNRLDLRL